MRSYRFAIPFNISQELASSCKKREGWMAQRQKTGRLGGIEGQRSWLQCLRQPPGRQLQGRKSCVAGMGKDWGTGNRNLGHFRDAKGPTLGHCASHLCPWRTWRSQCINNTAIRVTFPQLLCKAITCDFLRRLTGNSHHVESMSFRIPIKSWTVLRHKDS